MSYLIEQSKNRITRLEKHLEDAEKEGVSKERLDDIANELEREKQRLIKIETLNVEPVVGDMKAILSHTHAIEDKYSCRTVKFMFWLAEFTEKYISKSWSKGIVNYTMKKIHAPVCSIVANPTPDLPPMPKHGTKEEFERLDREKRERAEWMKWRELSINYLEAKPPKSFFSRIFFKGKK